MLAVDKHLFFELRLPDLYVTWQSESGNYHDQNFTAMYIRVDICKNTPGDGSATTDPYLCFKSILWL